MNYNYYDTPEGEDCFKKMLYTTKLATIAGLGISTADILLYSQPQGYFQTVARYGHFTLPFIGMAATFTAVTCIATTQRKKDDKLNYVLGGIAAAGVLGAWRKSFMAGFVGCFAFGIAGMLKKASVEDGWQFLSQPPLHTYMTHDLTLTKHRPGNWKVCEEEE